MGSYRTFRRGSWSYIVLILLVVAVLLVQPAVCAEQPDLTTERIILYTEPGTHLISDLFPDNFSISKNCTIVLQAPDLHFLAVEIPGNESVYYQNELLKLPWVTGIEDDVIRMPETLNNSSPNDPYLPDLWAYNHTHVPEAWAALSSHGTEAQCTVAILDTGIDITHEDLAGVIADGGFDWVNNSTAMTDSDGHGTFIAGIVGAIAGNGKGIAGIANVSLLPERVGTNISGIYASRSAVAIKHAADSGARIILMGYGGPGQSPAEEAAINYAVQKGCILIAPAGNNASNEGHYPSDYAEVISVGSTAKTDGLSYFSNYGIFVELVAPGEEMISTSPGNSYQLASGTSTAAALVAGAAALILDAEPALSRDQVRKILSSTARDLGRTGRDIYYGYGILDVGAAIEAVKSEYTGKVNKNSTISEVGPGNGSHLTTNNTTESSIPFPVKRAGPENLESVQIPLESGWNFISLPSVPGSGKTSGEVFHGINTNGHTIWKYDADTQDWISIEKESNFTPLEGFLVYSDRQSSLPLVLDGQNEKKEIPMSPGWNLIGSPYSVPVSAKEGLTSLSPDWVSLLMFNKTTQTYDPAVIQGANGTHADSRILPAFSAYWVYMNKGGLLRSVS